MKIIRKSPLFDTEWYYETYADVQESGMRADVHYARYGWKEGRNPSEYFGTNDYLKNNPDVKQAGMNPLVHYETYGKSEGRLPYSQLKRLKVLPNDKYPFSCIRKLAFGLESRIGALAYRKQIEKNKHARILVCLHLFYMQSWPVLAAYLSNLKPYNIDLVVTYVDGQYDKKTLREVKRSYPNAKLLKYPNSGFDIGSFIDVLNSIDLGQYDIVFKLHSKGIKRPFLFIYNQIFKYDDWFYNLFDGVLSGINTHRTIDKLMGDNKIGLVAAENLIVTDPLHKQHFTSVIAERLGVRINKEYHYNAGTCFAIRAKLLTPIQNLHLTINDFEGTRRGFFSLAHGMERLVCACIEPEGYIMDGNPTCHNVYKRQLRECQKYSASRMLHDPRFKLDYEFFYKALETKKLLNYEVIDMKLGDIQRRWQGEIIPLSETHPFKYLQGNIKQYNQYTRINKKRFGYSMTIDRFEELKESIDGGFDPMFMPVLDETNCLRDGQHRSCILLHKYGPEHTIKVIRIYMGTWNF